MTYNIVPFKHFVQIRFGTGPTDLFWALARGVEGRNVEVCVGYDLAGNDITAMYPLDEKTIVNVLPRRAFE